MRLPPATLRSWTLGRPYPIATGTGHFRPLIRPATTRPTYLSFWNLVEAHVLRAFRTQHRVSLKDLRTALEYSEKTLGIERLLLRRELCTTAGQVFLDRYGELINLSMSGQMAMRHVLNEHLKRVDWDERQFPVRLHPFISPDGRSSDQPIAIDPTVAFGRPVVATRSISTTAIADRIDAGETVEELARDYDLSTDEIELAVLYERAA